MASVNNKEGSSLVIGVTAVVISALAFSIYPILGKYVFAGGANLATILFVRFFVASLVFWGIALIQGGLPRLPLRTWLILLGMGGILYASMAALYLSSVRFIPASLAALLLYTYPILVTLLTVVLGQENINKFKVCGLTLSTLGLVLVLGVALHGIRPLGIFMALGSAAIYSIYIVIGNNVLQSTPPVVATAIITMGGAATYGADGWVQGFTWRLSWETWLGVLGIMFFCAVVAMLTFFLGVKHIGAARASILSTLEPVGTVAFAFIFFQERFTLAQALGGLLVLLGGLVAVWTPRLKIRRENVTTSHKHEHPLPK